jgi:alpha-tubulin suppressor-like RCC1 family protein
MAESLLIAALRQDSGDHVFKYLAPRCLARLEQCLTSKLVFVAAGEGDALLNMVAGRRHAEAAKAGATMLVPLGEEREGRATWATELRWIYLAMGRLRASGAKNMITAGDGHSLVTSGTETWSFGSGVYGKLGHGGAGREVVPRLIEALNRVAVKQVEAGYFHSMVLASEGLVWTWGDGDNGRLGHGNTDNQNVPKRVGGLTNVTDIASGGGHSLAVVNGGSVYTWGSNHLGQLGLGDHGGGTDRRVPTLVGGMSGVVAVAGGYQHSLALGRDGTTMACGWNNADQLGLGDTANRDTFTVVAGLRGVVDIDAGGRHSIAVTCEGEVWTWGRGAATGHGVDDDDAQWLVPTKVTGGGIGEAMVVQVAAGRGHSMARTATGGLYSWGKGDSGLLGHGEKEHLDVPRVVVDGIGVVVGMAGGSMHSLVTTAEGNVLACGSNGEDGAFSDAFYGRLGLGAGVAEALTPTAIDGITVGVGGGEGKEGKE